MTDAYRTPDPDVSFGDIFDLGFLYDVHVRADAVALGARDLGRKSGGGLAYAPTFPNPRWVLARGEQAWAMVISDSCAVDTALGQDRDNARPKGRLLFAPVAPLDPPDAEVKSFGRFPLPEWPGAWQAGVVELRRCFMVDARDVAENRDKRKGALTEEVAEQLEIRWSAYAARRGPLASLRNSEKLAEVLVREHGEAQISAAYVGVAQAVAATLTTAWRIEGADLDAIADCHAKGAGGLTEAAALRDSLRALQEHAGLAADYLGVLVSGD